MAEMAVLAVVAVLAVMAVLVVSSLQVSLITMMGDGGQLRRLAAGGMDKLLANVTDKQHREPKLLLAAAQTCLTPARIGAGRFAGLDYIGHIFFPGPVVSFLKQKRFASRTHRSRRGKGHQGASKRARAANTRAFTSAKGLPSCFRASSRSWSTISFGSRCCLSVTLAKSLNEPSTRMVM